MLKKNLAVLIDQSLKGEIRHQELTDFLLTTKFASLVERPNFSLEKRFYTLPTGRKVKMICPTWGSGELLFFSKRKWLSLISPLKKATHRAKVFEAARNSVADQIKIYRSQINVGIEYDIDHVIPFIQLFDQWLEFQDLFLDQIKIKGRSSSLRDFADPELGLSWKNFHQENAVLKALPRSENRSLGAKGYSSSKPIPHSL